MNPVSTLRLGDLCDLVSLQVDPAATPSAAYIGLEHVPPGRFWISRHGLAQEAQSSKFKFAEGDVLYGKLRPYLDKAVIAPSSGVCTTELLVLRPRSNVPSTYLAAVVHAPGFTEHAMSGVTGAHHPRTSWHHISEFELPQHGGDQRQKIGNLLSRIQRLIECVEAQATTALEIKSGAMDALFSRGLRGMAQKETEIGALPESWDVVPFGTVREWLQYGTSIRCSTEPATYAVLRIPNIGSGTVIPDDLKYCDMSASEAAKYRLELGDLIFIRTNGVLERLGSCAVYRGAPQQALFASYLIRARLDLKRVEPRFVAHFYGSKLGTSLVAGRATPASDGKYNLNTGTIDALPLPVPPTLDEQVEIAEILDAIDAKIALHQQKRAVLEGLFKALLHKLMTGEIDVNDLDLSALQPAT